MYKNFFGLRENPFNVNPDPRFLYSTLHTQKALDELAYGIQNRKGLILLTGEVGTGKTTLINCLLDWLRHRETPTAFIFNSRLSTNNLFEFILTDFGIPIDIQLKSNMLMRLNTWLIECFRAGESPVLIVDEAQGLSFNLLEEIRLLLNLETGSEKLLQIVLAGQPELEDKLKRPELRQLRQRITLRCNTKPLTLEESRAYITERLRISGATGDLIFTSDAMDAVHFYSQGIPRVINLLCEHALINAYAEHFRPVPARMVEEAAHEFFLDESRRFAKEEAHLQVPSHATSLPELTAFDAFEESAVTARNSTVTTARHPEAISASMANSNAAAFLKDLMLASAQPEVKSKESALCLDSIPRVSGSAIPFNTEKKQNQVTNLASAPLHLIRSRTEDESSSAAKRSPISDAQSRTLRSSRRPVIHALLLSWKSWCSQRVTGFLSTASLAGWSHVSLVALRRIRQSVFLGQALLRRWKREFRRDWIAMINDQRHALLETKKILSPLTTAAYSFKQLVTSKVALLSHQPPRRTKH
jgi:general secretion pathway protein A